MHARLFVRLCVCLILVDARMLSLSLSLCMHARVLAACMLAQGCKRMRACIDNDTAKRKGKKVRLCALVRLARAYIRVQKQSQLSTSRVITRARLRVVRLSHTRITPR